MTLFIQLDLSDEEMQALNTEATAAGYTVMEYVRLKLGFVQAARQMRDKREAIAPNLETKDAPEVERPSRRRAGHPPAE
jgi:hypothetical protein